MKKILTGTLFTTLILCVSCGSKTKLADQISGVWKGNAELLGSGGDTSKTITEEYNFVKNNENGGDLIINAQLSQLNAVEPNDEIIEPYSISVSGTAGAKGTWTATNDKTIEVSIDLNSLNMVLDPFSVIYEKDVITGVQDPEMSQINPETEKMIKEDIMNSLTRRYTNMKALDKVRISDNKLTFEVGRKAKTMMKVI